MPDYVFNVRTPLGFDVHCTHEYWRFVSEVKHPVLAGRVEEVVAALAEPDEIRRSSKDAAVLLFYRGASPRWMCAVAKREGEEGFLITAYPTDAVKMGESIWRKSE